MVELVLYKYNLPKWAWVSMLALYIIIFASKKIFHCPQQHFCSLVFREVSNFSNHLVIDWKFIEAMLLVRCALGILCASAVLFHCSLLLLMLLLLLLFCYYTSSSIFMFLSFYSMAALFQWDPYERCHWVTVCHMDRLQWRLLSSSCRIWGSARDCQQPPLGSGTWSIK